MLMSDQAIPLDCDARQRSEVTYACWYRVVWSTKFHRPLLEGLEQEVVTLLSQGVESLGAQAQDIEVTARSVSLRLSVSPLVGIHKVVRALKARSYTDLRKRYPGLRSRTPSLWTNRYLVLALGTEPSADVVAGFLRDQKNF